MSLSIQPRTLSTQSRTLLTHRRSNQTDQRDVTKLVTFDSENNEYVFHLVEDLKRDSTREDLLQVQDKVLNYLEYAFSGDMARDFPDSMLSPFRFQLYCFEYPRGLAKVMIEDTANRLKNLGIGFRVTVFE
jgi:hypothetical protein